MSTPTTVRLPADLESRIDAVLQTKGRYRSRSNFLQEAAEQLLRAEEGSGESSPQKWYFPVPFVQDEARPGYIHMGVDPVTVHLDMMRPEGFLVSLRAVPIAPPHPNPGFSDAEAQTWQANSTRAYADVESVLVKSIIVSGVPILPIKGPVAISNWMGPDGIEFPHNNYMHEGHGAHITLAPGRAAQTYFRLYGLIRPHAANR